MKKIALAALLLTGATAPSFGAGYDDLNAGISYLNLGRYDDAITWLDKAIADGDLIPDHIRVTNLDRGIAYLGKRDGQKAMDAFAAAIAAQPDDLTAYQQRIIIYNLNGMLEKAAADYETLNRLRPHDFNTIMNMGRTDWFLDRPEASEAAFALYPENSFAWLWLQVAHVRLGKPVDGMPAYVTAKSPWPTPIARLYRGELSETDMMTAAGSSKGDAICEGNVFAGLWRRVHADSAGAKQLFENAFNVCPKGGPSWETAKRELARQAAGAKTP